MFGTRNHVRGRLEQLAREAPDGCLVAARDDLWLLSSGAGLLLLVEAGPDRAAARQRSTAAAERLRRELFELLTVAPFVDPLVVVPDDVQAVAAEVNDGLLRHLLEEVPTDPVVARVGELIDEGRLGTAWRRVAGAAVAG